MEHLKELVFLLLSGVSTDGWLLWRNEGSAICKRLIISWFGCHDPSGGFGLAFGKVALSVIHLCGAIIDLEEAF